MRRPSRRGGRISSFLLFHLWGRDARYDLAGDLVTLGGAGPQPAGTEAEIGRAQTTLDTALRRGQVGPYQLQAAIAAEHAVAAAADRTDWPEIARLYSLLAGAAPSPVVDLNRAVAVAMADGPAAGLALLEPLERSGELAGYLSLLAESWRLAATAGLTAWPLEESEARAAIELAPSDAERRFLTRRLEEVTAVH